MNNQTFNTGDTILNLYKVKTLLGRGGFGEVYQVRHLNWKIDLAVKIPNPQTIAKAGGIEEFEKEAETWIDLGLHPHTVSCYYVRRLENKPLVFAEYMAGGSLHDWIEKKKLYEGGKEASLQRILDIAIQFAWGLHYAHEQGLIHQDVKPQNVMMTPEGVVKVTDFGLARGRFVALGVPPFDPESDPPQPPLIRGESDSPLDKGGKGGSGETLVATGVAMTQAYCSPEQASKQKLTRRTDIWSWAVSLLEMFQGERTWEYGQGASYYLEDYLETEQQNPQLPQMPESVVELLRNCFKENPDERPHTMLDVANELQGIYQQITGETYPRILPKVGKDMANSLNNRAVSGPDTVR